MTPAGVLGIGIDIIENQRIRNMLDRWSAGFKDRVFLPEEQTYCDAKAMPWHHYAARFAVKEAVTKAFGTGIGPHLNWLDIQVKRNADTGEPRVELSEKGRALADSRGVGRILVSLSHTADYSVAQAMIIARDAS